MTHISPYNDDMEKVVKRRIGRPRGYADREKEVMGMLRNGLTVREIERLTGVPKSIVHRLKQQMAGIQ